MEDDKDAPLERETKDFLFHQLKKTRLFPSAPDLPKERSNLLAVSNKYGFLFAGGPAGLKIYRTDDVLIPIKPGEDPNDIKAAPPGIEVPSRHPVHHVALSSDNLTLSVCTSSSDCGSSVLFYDVRTLVGESEQQKEAFTSRTLSGEADSFVTDLKWNPVVSRMVAVCLSDGSISVLEVTDTAHLSANLPASLGVTCMCWSPNGEQLAAGKLNGTVVQYVPTLEECKEIPCPSFYESDPVKVLDILWVSTYDFAVVYASTDDSSDISPQLVMVLLPKKDDKRGVRFQNFTETCYSSAYRRQHQFFMMYIDGWDILLGASANSIEVSVMARSADQSLWELWLLEDSCRAELPVTDNSEDTLPMGVVASYTSQMTVYISIEEILPPSPVLLLLSTDGVLCPFHMVNKNHGVKSVTKKPEHVPMEGERPITASGIGSRSPTPGPAVAITSPPQPGALISNLTNAPPAGCLGKCTTPALSLLTKPQASALSLPSDNASAKPQTTTPIIVLSASDTIAKPQTTTPAFIHPPADASVIPETTTPTFTLPPADPSANLQTTPPAYVLPPAAEPSVIPAPSAPTFSFSAASLSGEPQSSPDFSLPDAKASAKPQIITPASVLPPAESSAKPQTTSLVSSLPAADVSANPQTTTPTIDLPAADTIAKPQTTTPASVLPPADLSANLWTTTPAFLHPPADPSANRQSTTPALSLPSDNASAKPQTTTPIIVLSASDTIAKPQTTTPAFIHPPADASVIPETTTPTFTLPPADPSANLQTTPPAYVLPPAAEPSVIPAPSAPTFSFSAASLSGEPQSSPHFGLSSTSVSYNPRSASFGFGMTTSTFSFNPQVSSAFGVPPTSPPIGAPDSSSSALSGTSAWTICSKSTWSPGSPCSLEPAGGTFKAATSKPEITNSSTKAADSSVQPVAPSIRVIQKDKFGPVDLSQPKPSFAPSTADFPFTPQVTATTPAAPVSSAMCTPSQSMAAPSRPSSDVSQSSQSAPSPVTQKVGRDLPGAAKQTTPQFAVLGSSDKAADSKDPVHTVITEEICHFQKDLDDLKARTAQTCFTVGTEDEMRRLRTESEDHQTLLQEIQDITKSLHGDIGNLKTTVLEGLANAEYVREQKGRLSDPVYRQLLYKKPLDLRSKTQLQDIRRLHHYVRSEVQAVSDVLDLEWDNFIESKKKQKGYTVPDRETMYNTLANNREMINHLQQHLNQVVESLCRRRLYNKTAWWMSEESRSHSNDGVESLQDTLSKTTIDTTIKPEAKPQAKLSPVKQNQLRHFLTKRKTPPVRSLAPANLSRSSFLHPSYRQDLDNDSSPSSLLEAAESQVRMSEPDQGPARQKTPPPDPSPVRAVHHVPDTCTVSVQTGFGFLGPPYEKVLPSSGPITGTPAVSGPSMRVTPPGADRTILATRTGKPRPPTVPATQARTTTAMRRQRTASPALVYLTLAFLLIGACAASQGTLLNVFVCLALYRLLYCVMARLYM